MASSTSNITDILLYHLITNSNSNFSCVASAFGALRIVEIRHRFFYSCLIDTYAAVFLIETESVLMQVLLFLSFSL